MIGVFDSGLGGLTILDALVKKLPKHDYMYLGDSARMPYGNKSQSVIYDYTAEAVDFLFKQGCELVIIACNTASAKALRKIQQEYLPKNYPNKRVLGVLIPAVEEIAEHFQKCPPKSGKKRLGIIATRATVQSKTYDQEIAKLDSGIEIFSKATPLLVPLVEEGWIKRPETKTILKKYLHPLKQKQVQALILGCTHYPILAPMVERIMTKQVKVIDTPRAVAKKLVDYLNRHPEIEKKLPQKGKRIFYTTDDPGRFKELGSRFLQREIREVEKIELAI